VLRNICKWSFWFTSLLIFGSSISMAQGFTFTRLARDVGGAFALAVGDLDGDGDLDIAVSCKSPGMVLWLENRPDSLTQHVLLYVDSPGSRGIAVADIDQDGDSDIVVAAYGQGRFIWYENVGGAPAGMFVEHTIFTASHPWSVSVGDADGDGRPDLLLSDYTGHTVRIMHLENGTWITTASFNNRDNGISYPFDAIFADLNGDGIQDIVGTCNYGPVYWIEQSAAHTWRVDHTLTFGVNSFRVAAADIDGDGATDIMATPFVATQTSWWERNGSAFQEHPLLGSVYHPSDVRIADLDQDGLPDLAACDEAGRLIWWRNTGSDSFQVQAVSPGASYYNLCITDFDRDGDPDILAADGGAGEIILYRNTMGIPAVVKGVITSADHQAIAGARVRLAETGLTGISNSQGGYLLATRAGTYTMIVSQACYNPDQRQNVQVLAHDTIAVDFTLFRGLLQCATTSLNMMAHNHSLSLTELPVANTGDGYLRIAATAQSTYPNDDWLHVSPDTLLLPAGQTGTFVIRVEPDTSDAQGWDYAGEVTLRSNSCPDSVRHIGVLVYVLDAPEKPAALPMRDVLLPIYPNPFNLEATLRFELKSAVDVHLVLYDVNGRLVQQLAQERMDAGAHQLSLHGDHLTSGVYFVVMQTPHAQFTQKILLLK
jgi:hypothetical protein